MWTTATGPDQLRRSIDSLQRLYTIVVGLAVTEALRNFLSPELVTSPWANWKGLVVVLFTVVPFYHGANGHLDQTYLFGFLGERREKRFALLVDFFMLFLEGILFFALAVSLKDFDRFVAVFQALLIVDVAWAAVVFFMAESSTDDSTHAKKWGLLNLITFIVVTFVHDAVVIAPDARANWIPGVAFVRSCVDYWLCWDFYMARYPMMVSADTNK